MSNLEQIFPLHNHALKTKTTQHTKRPNVLVIGGLNLDDLEAEQRVEGVIARLLGQDVPILWMLSQPSMRNQVRARSRGAMAVLPASASSETIRSAVIELASLNPKEFKERRDQSIRLIIGDICAKIAIMLVSAGHSDSFSNRTRERIYRLLLRTIHVREIGYWMDTVSIVHRPTLYHSILMAGIAATFAIKLDLNNDDLHKLINAAMLHDIGKMLVPMTILEKPIMLSDQEMAVMQRHPDWAHELLQEQATHHPTVLAIVRHHHELLDGTGYPLGLSGQKIDIHMRIATICDIFSALIEKRIYKPGFDPHTAFAIMLAMDGKLDPYLLKIFGYLFVQTKARSIREHEIKR